MSNMICYRCYAPTSVQPCTQCRQIEALEKQNDLIKSNNEQQRKLSDEAAREAASIAREQARAQEYANAMLVEIEERKLLELQKQTQLIQESSISTDQAYQEGYNLKFISSSNMKNTLNEDGTFKAPVYQNPYVTARLNEAYDQGLRLKLASLVVDQTYFHNMILSCGQEGLTNFYIGANLTDSIEATIERNCNPYEISTNDQTGEVKLVKTGQVPFADPVLNQIYLTGLDQFIAAYERANNTDELKNQRLIKIQTDKRIEDRKLGREVALVLTFTAIILGSLGYAVIWGAGKIISLF